MKRLLLLIFAGFTGISLAAQESHTAIVPGKKTFRPFLAVNTGLSYSVINNRKEVRGNYKPGITGGLSFYTSPWFALSGDYTWFFPHDASPAFVDIHSWNSEFNCNFIMGIGKTDMKFKALFGVSYMNWKGTFIGPSLNDNNKYYYGLVVDQHWVAGNLGCGISHTIKGNFIAGLDFRTRFASEKRDLVSISDTAFNLGLTWQMRGSSADMKNNPDAHRKTTKAHSNRLYKWMKKGAKH